SLLSGAPGIAIARTRAAVTTLIDTRPFSGINLADGSYNIPSAGVYAVGFAFRYGTGLQASLLSGAPGIAIARTRAAVTTLIDTRPFSGINLA
ncbi:hypothetical protein BOQ60_25340, partial [Chryseobacterium sp. CH1]